VTRLLRGLSAIVYKELIQVRKDLAALVLALVIPSIQLTIFGYAIDTEVRDVETVVLDRSHTRLSRYYVDALRNTDVFRPAVHVQDREELHARIRSGRAKVGVIIPDDFSERILNGETGVVQVLVDGSDSNVANQAMAAAVQTGNHVTRIIRQRHPEGHGGPAPGVEVRPRVLYNPDQRSAVFFVPALAAIILQLVTMVLTAFSIVRERERGTLEQLLVTPVSRLGLLLGKILPFLLVGIVETAIVFLAMVFVFDVPIAGSFALLAALTVVFLFCSLALGLFVSTVARTQIQAMLLSMLIFLPSVLLSGFMFPRETMPRPIFYLTHLFPATYFVAIMRGIVLRGAGLADLWPHILPLAGLGVGLLALGVARFRKRVG